MRNSFMMWIARPRLPIIRDRLGAITFYEGLGTVAQKADRMAALAGAVARQTGAQMPILPAARPVSLRLIWSPAWSVNSLNFRALWAVIMQQLAVRQPEVADAMTEHYRPQGPSDAIPV